MTERIHAVQRMFWALCATALLLCALGFPLGHDAETMEASNELQTFDAGFDRHALEHDLLGNASAQGMLALAEVVRATGSNEGVPQVSAAPSAQAITPRTALALRTLADVHALSLTGATLELGVPSADALGRALGWRLSRLSGAERYELLQVTLGPRGCTPADLTREQSVADERTALLAARKAAQKAKTSLQQAQDLFDQRRKWKASWKGIASANQQRQEAAAALNSAETASREAEQRYATHAQEAEKFGGGPAGDGDCVVASASLRALPAGKALTLLVPTPVQTRRVGIPNLSGADFPVLQRTKLWAEVQGGSAKDGLAKLRQRFSWHYRYVELGGIKLGGMTVLQFAPLLLLLLFLSLLRRSSRVAITYNPFDRPSGEQLPRVGLGSGIANLTALVLLPALGCALCAISLIGVQQWPVVPVLCGLSAIGLGSKTYFVLKALVELSEAVTRSHSHPPPTPN